MRLLVTRQRCLLCAVVLWAIAVGAGYARLQDYATTPGTTGPAPVRWPTACPLERRPGRANLILFAHPHCPCTRATVAELEQVLARCEGLLSTRVLFYRPAGFPENWEKTDLWRRAEGIPGVEARADEDGAIARRFGATTSGEAHLYDASGRLLFRGGITTARGHAGASAGSAAILSVLANGTTAPSEAPVFGCPLADCAGP